MIIGDMDSICKDVLDFYKQKVRIGMDMGMNI